VVDEERFGEYGELGLESGKLELGLVVELDGVEEDEERERAGARKG